MITKEILEQEIRELRVRLEAVRDNGNALAGAIQLAEKLLKRFDEPQVPENSQPVRS